MVLDAQTQHQKNEEIFLITTKGLRWQEVFNGADPFLLCHAGFVQDTALVRALYGGATAKKRRQKPMPFFRPVLAKDRQLWGNRTRRSKVDMQPGSMELVHSR